MIFRGPESAGDLKRSDAHRAQKPSSKSAHEKQHVDLSGSFALFLSDSFSLLKIPETASTLTFLWTKFAL